MMHRFKLLANGFGILLGAGAAHADEVVIRLGNETQLAPSHLCVASQTIRDLLPEERAGQKPNSECGRGAGQQRGSECAPGLSGAFQFVETRTPDGVTGVGLVQGLLASAAKSSRTNPIASAKTACGDWRPTDGELNVEMRSCELPRRAACDVVSVAAGQLAKDQALSCRANTQLSGARGRLGVAILDFQQAHIQGFSLTGHVARIRLEPTRAELEALPIIKVVGGTYLQSAEVPLREITGTDLVELPLVPRCSEQHIAMPSYECPAALDSAGDDIVIVRTGTSDLQVSREWLAHSPVLDIPNVSASMSQLTLLACFDPNKKVQRLEDAFAHELVARWHPADPPEPRQMVPNRLQFFWARDGLVNEDECPAAPELVERGVKCSRLEGARASSTCAYECAGGIQLPTIVQLSRERTRSFPPENHPPAAQVWELALARPGQTLHGFVSPAEAELSLHWCGWTDERLRDRATQWGEQIPAVVLGSGDGRAFRVAPNTPRLRVANVQRGDAFSVTFEGKRVYRSDIARVGAGGVLTIWHPAASREGARPECHDVHVGVQSDLRADKVVFALALAGGLRSADEGETRTRWSPYGEVDVVTTVRAWRRHLGDFYYEPEVRAGVALTTGPYAKGFDASSLQDESRQRNVTTALFPVEVMLHFFDNQPLHFALGPGIVFSRPLFSTDVERVANAPKFSLAINMGIGVSNAFAIDGDLRLIWGNQRVEKTFDEGGLSRQHADEYFMTMLGVRLRLNDAFDGGMARPVSAPEEERGAMPKAAAVGAPDSASAVAGGPVTTPRAPPPPSPRGPSGG